MPERQECPFCPVKSTERVFAISETNAVVRCTGCGLEFAEEYPEYHDLGTRTYDLAYFTRAMEDSARRRRIFDTIVAQLEDAVGDKGYFLDVGAGEGGMLLAARDRGWRTVRGTDISQQVVDFVRDQFQLEVFNGPIEDVELETARYDAVTMNHVLEHVRNPGTTLRRVASLLNDRGVVRIEVPNMGSLSSRLKSLQSRMHLKREPWKHYSTNHHFWYYKPSTLRFALESSDLEVIDLYAPQRQWEVGGPVGRLTDGLAERLGLGKHIVAFCRKKRGSAPAFRNHPIPR
jgi:2-polyprenyl-3-methyl-5-hydroxy-6-metoxy-1,4-benzoquinol methylase